MCNASIRGAEDVKITMKLREASWGVQGQPGLHSDFQARLSYRVKTKPKNLQWKKQKLESKDALAHISDMDSNFVWNASTPSLSVSKKTINGEINT